MKKIVKLVILGSLVSPFMALADFDPCDRVFTACAAQGFTKDEIAPVGKKIWLNCADVIVNQKKSVAGVELDPKSPDAKYCRDYREARAKFDTEWGKKNKRPTAN